MERRIRLMKKGWLAVLITMLAITLSPAQEPAPEVPDVLIEEIVTLPPPVSAEESVAYQAHMFHRIFGLDVQWEGAAAKSSRMGNPLQLFNPFAPLQYGDGYDNVTVDPDTGRATGMKLLGIRF